VKFIKEMRILEEMGTPPNRGMKEEEIKINLMLSARFLLFGPQQQNKK